MPALRKSMKQRQEAGKKIAQMKILTKIGSGLLD